MTCDHHYNSADICTRCGHRLGTTAEATDTLGYHRKMALAVFGEDSPAVAFLDGKIAASPNGADEKVIAPESQMVALLVGLHTGVTP